jgi:sarcosine oxidase, subunit gamma
MDEMTPLTRLPPVSAPIVAGPVAINAAPAAARFVLRGGGAAAERASKAFGPSLPTRPCMGAQADRRIAMWLGPDEWLLIAEAEESAALAVDLAEALRDCPNSLVDVSHRQIALTVEGSGAPRLLSAGCPLDLHPRAFPAGMVARTVLAKAEIVLWRRSGESFRLEIGRSFADYVVALLSEAARGLPEF